MSEELEHSLQQAIENYLGERLHAIDEQLSRLQAEFNDAIKRLRESAVPESLAATPMGESISAHLQAAREQRLTQGVIPADETPNEVAAIKRAVAAIEKQQSQAEILGSLLTGAAQFAERVALFVLKNEQALGWRKCEASNPTNLESIRGITLPLSAETLLSSAVRSSSSWSGAPGSHSEDDLLIAQLGGTPQNAAAVPLVVRGKVVAVMYVDAASSDPNAINVDALELLTRVAGMAVGLASGARPAPDAQVNEADTATGAERVAAFEKTHDDEPRYQPAVEPQAADAVTESKVEDAPAPEVSAPEIAQESAIEVTPVEAEVIAEPATEVVTESHVEAAPAAEAAIEVVAEDVAEEEAVPAPEPMPEPAFTSPAPAPVFNPPPRISVAQYSTPLGRSRSRVAEPELPIEVSEEERRLHHDARRFARLLVSEIKLYNELKVKEGRSQGDLYDRLREDIDRSRQMYDRRVAPPVAARHDYFHQELVNTLAEGDSAKLGAEYPGASVAMV